MKTTFYISIVVALLILLNGCRGDENILPSEETVVDPNEEVSGNIQGFFLLNEGNMGSNKASLDYYDFAKGSYTRDIFPERNPGVAKELGDVGNDLQVHGGKLYAVMNSSNLVEVMDARTAKHLATISIPNCRYITFDKGYAYVTSYAGEIILEDPNMRLGYVAKIDTTTLSIVSQCEVGFQPDQMAVVNNKLYVANSGGYMIGVYDNTVSVIDLNTFTETTKIEVGINLYKIVADSRGMLYVSSRGDHYSTSSMVYVIDSSTDRVVKELPLLQATGMAMKGDSLYVYSSDYSYITDSRTVTYGIYNTLTEKVVTRKFITDGTDAEIKEPYGIAVHPATGDIYITDASDYVTPGRLYCFNSDGKRKWSVRTGDVPSRIAFTTHKLLPKE